MLSELFQNSESTLLLFLNHECGEEGGDRFEERAMMMRQVREKRRRERERERERRRGRREEDKKGKGESEYIHIGCIMICCNQPLLHTNYTTLHYDIM